MSDVKKTINKASDALRKLTEHLDNMSEEEKKKIMSKVESREFKCRRICYDISDAIREKIDMIAT